jgi:TolB-like protein
MTEPNKAIFLSYAREDAESVRRIADALRAFGVEVWFDQNELRGGDSWDQKIKRQIRECTLFLPVISATTQARGEGYFRREWKQAVERTHDMASGVAFIVPVVIDETPESEAAVPEEFMRYQWTRLPHGVPSPQFVEQVKRLLDAPRKPTGVARARPAESRSEAAPSPKKARAPLVWIASATALATIAVVLLFALKPTPEIATARAADANPTAQPSKPLAPSNEKSIAVLPFANLSTERENEFFAEGMHDDVITSLAKIRDLTVISRTSVLAYRDPAARNLKKIAAELGAAHVLEGSVRRVGHRVRINAQLIDARSDAHVWAETFEGDASDIFALQARLAQEIAGALKAKLTAAERSLIGRRLTEDPVAYDLYLRARTAHQEIGEAARSVQTYEEVIALYQRAAQQDPTFALPHAQLTMVHSILYWFGRFDPSPARQALAKAALDNAVRLAPDAPETRLAMGAYHYRVFRDWQRAEQEFHSAEQGLPNDAQLCFWLAVTHRRLGQWAESLRYFERALMLNPREKASLVNYAEFLNDVRHFEKAAQVAARGLQTFPDEPALHLTLASAQFALQGAVTAFAQALSNPVEAITPENRFSQAYRAALLTDNAAEAERLIVAAPFNAVSEAQSNVIPIPLDYFRAEVAFVRGDRAQAKHAAERGIQFYQSGTWNDRQTQWVRMKVALLKAWSGRSDEAEAEGKDALAAMQRRDAYDATNLLIDYSLIQLAAGQHGEALATLGKIMTGPSVYSPGDFRHLPHWKPLRDNPKFETILRSARAL